MRRILVVSAALSLAATPALAHPGLHHASGFAAGFSHPFGGLDHLLAMVAVGLWAGLATPGRPWLWPAAFLAFMVAGFTAGFASLALPGVETMVLASLVALGLAAALRWRAPVAVGCALAGLFAVAHGYAHGVEVPASVSGLTFAAGFVTASAILQGLGVALARTASSWRAEGVARAAGLGVALAGVAMAWAG